MQQTVRIYNIRCSIYKCFRPKLKIFAVAAALISGALMGETVDAQRKNPASMSARQLKKVAEYAKRTGDQHAAIHFYEMYLQKDSSNQRVNFQLALLQRDVRNYFKARDLFYRVFTEEGEKFPLSEYYYAEALKATGEYDSAKIVFNTFKKNYRNIKGKKNQDYKDYSRKVRIQITGIDSAKMLMERPLNLTINSLNSTINSPHVELSPFPIDNNTFIYASLKLDEMIFTGRKPADSLLPSRKFYLANKSGLDWIGGERIKWNINIEGVETCNGVLSRDGERFYFTRCEQNWQGKEICSIYLTKKEEDGWTDPEKLPAHINNPDYTSTHPALGNAAADGKEILYFVSDRPGGRGGLDIWYSVWSDTRKLWSRVKNCGGSINSRGDDITPFYFPQTRSLYFSSNGYAGMGGYDIYSASGEKMRFTKPLNAGHPINSSYDDLYYTASKTGEFGFFASNRPGLESQSNQTCCDDIYYYSWNNFIKITTTGLIYPFEKDKYGRKRNLDNFDFFNPPSYIKPLENATIAMYRMNKDTKEYEFQERFTTERNGRYSFTMLPNEDYEFRMEGFQYFDSKNFFSTEGMNFSDEIEMPPIWVNVLSSEPVVLENVYFDFNSSVLKDSVKSVLDSTILLILKEAPEFVAEIGAHTDSIGTRESNMELSIERAESVVSYLVRKGISRNRLVAKGYGASQPVAPNFNADGSDNPDGRAQNRRTEFRIIGTIGQEEDDEEYFDYLNETINRE
ncbi:MAG: OmpA family protein [Bacteroidales bacterium]|nr:OmpA family protein [Bacteroidales bacterium]